MSSNNEILQERINELENVFIEYKDNNIYFMSFSSRERLFDFFENNTKCFNSFGIYETGGIDFDRAKNSSLFIIKNNDEIYFRTNKNIFTSLNEFLASTMKNTVESNSKELINDSTRDLPPDCFTNILAIDFETANELNDKACSVGISLFKDAQIVLNKEFLINPQTTFNNMNISVHGITPSMVKDSPIFPDVWNEIKPYINDKTLVLAHNAAFDISLLKKLISIYNCDDISFKYLCTYKLYRQNINLEKYNLKYVASYLGEEFEHHKALDDSIICLKAFLHIANEPHKFSENYLIENHNAIIDTFCMTATDRLYKAKTRKTNTFSSYANNFKPSDLIPKTTNFDTTHPVYKKTFVFSGDLPSFDSKMDAAQRVIDLGGIYKGSLVKTCNYLVVGIDLKTGQQMSGTKVQKANDYNTKGCNIELVSEYEFLMLLNSGNDSISTSYENTQNDDITSSLEHKIEEPILDVEYINDVVCDNANISDYDFVDVSETVIEVTNESDNKVEKAPNTKVFKSSRHNTQMSLFDMAPDTSISVNTNDSPSAVSKDNDLKISQNENNIVEIKSEIISTNDINSFIAPSEFVSLDDDTKLELLKLHKLISSKATIINKAFYYKGAFTNTPLECDIIGHIDTDILIIKINSSLHSIRAEYLKQMQETGFENL